MNIANHISPSVPRYRFDSSILLTGELEQQNSETLDKDKGPKLRCWVCEHIITDNSQRVTVNGYHNYSRTNPSGITYEFACFGNAAGCTAIGEPSREHSWFVDHTWQIAICRECGEHLGWLFKGDGRFFGLICKRLITDEET